MVGQGRPSWIARRYLDAEQRLPAGSELMLASVLGFAGWWAIAQAVRWLAG